VGKMFQAMTCIDKLNGIVPENLQIIDRPDVMDMGQGSHVYINKCRMIDVAAPKVQVDAAIGQAGQWKGAK